MKKSLLLFISSTLLLAGCTNYKHTCALANSEQITAEEAAKALGLVKKHKYTDISWSVKSFCEFYKN